MAVTKLSQRSGVQAGPRYESLYQINTRVWVTELSSSLGRPATLDDVPNAELDRIANQGFDWIWLLSVWQTGQVAQQVSRSNPDWRREFQDTLPDLTDDDIPGSGFAVTSYSVHSNLGGKTALARLRKRLKSRGLKLMLDFVPNHMGLGHPWVEEHPEHFIHGTTEDLANNPQNFLSVRSRGEDVVLAYGRDPYFAGWPDTLQLNYANPATQEAMIGELLQISNQCDGVRCDMAMLVLPDVFERTWGQRAPLFWPEATNRIRDKVPDFTFMAEVYWDLEWTLQQQGFDYCYDKRLYDRLREGHARPVREHFWAGLNYQDKLARFLENHDEPRAAATFAPSVHFAAAVITFLASGLRFFHQGQFEGCVKRVSPHLGRRPVEAPNAELVSFYDRLLSIIRTEIVRNGQWRILESHSAWEDNGTHDNFITFGWELPPDERWVVVVNYSPIQSQCRIKLPWSELSGNSWELKDLLSSEVYERNGDELVSQGLFIDMKPWQTAIYELRQLSSK